MNQQKSTGLGKYLLANYPPWIVVCWDDPSSCVSCRSGCLSRQAAVALVGPCQVGKTTLAHAIAAGTASIHLDLEAREDRAKLAAPALFLNNYEDRLVVLDQILCGNGAAQCSGNSRDASGPR